MAVSSGCSLGVVDGAGGLKRPYLGSQVSAMKRRGVGMASLYSVVSYPADRSEALAVLVVCQVAANV